MYCNLHCLKRVGVSMGVVVVPNARIIWACMSLCKLNFIATLGTPLSPVLAGWLSWLNLVKLVLSQILIYHRYSTCILCLLKMPPTFSGNCSSMRIILVASTHWHDHANIHKITTERPFTWHTSGISLSCMQISRFAGSRGKDGRLFRYIYGIQSKQHTHHYNIYPNIDLHSEAIVAA